MPEAAIDEDGDMVARQHDVRLATRGEFPLQAEAKARSVEPTSQREFRFRVLASARTKMAAAWSRNPCGGRCG